ncbi:hypothetical protein BFP70_07840 [Thioclava sp. SK-1]|uniref:hypothetical protein n=1 Tax=Thioclava sp. SK-1 TaxID=1889770 RepID=UPI0008252E0D|nr:hypothetical protein [Thioclava sp. SK-1]OCX66192.1 hypothetical protein BFP70_07840 [Thioclava sp. SK-1]
MILRFACIFLMTACFAGWAGAADVSPPLDAAAFDARTSGKTITYSSGGMPYGVEQYLPHNRVLWAFAEGECKEGTWFQNGPQICFDYQDDNGLQCWTFHDTDNGLMARFMGDDDSTPLISLTESAEPLACPGPDIGV